MNRQLALTIQPNEESTFANFFWTSENHWVRTHLLNALENHGEQIIYLWGHPGSGKSHLLQACVHHLNVSQPAIYLPLQSLKDWGPAVIEGLEEQTLLCVDAVDAIATDKAWEEALFHLYNRIRDQGKSRLIITGYAAPTYSSIQLPDLRSRLGGSLVLQLHELNDEDKVNALCFLAQKRGLELAHTTAQFLVSRWGRNMHDLHALLQQLDEASWVAQRKLTIPFIKKILSI